MCLLQIGVTQTKVIFFQYIQAYKYFDDPVPLNTKQYQFILTQYHPTMCQPVPPHTDPVPPGMNEPVLPYILGLVFP